MKILIKIEEFKKDKNTIIGRFCNWKSQKPIDSYKKRMISCEGLDDSNIVNFVESLGEQASMKIYSDEKRLPSPPENNPIKLNENMCVDDLIGKVICIDYPPKFYKKICVRRVEL